MVGITDMQRGGQIYTPADMCVYFKYIDIFENVYWPRLYNCRSYGYMQRGGQIYTPADLYIWIYVCIFQIC